MQLFMSAITVAWWIPGSTLMPETWWIQGITWKIWAVTTANLVAIPETEATIIREAMLGTSKRPRPLVLSKARCYRPQLPGLWVVQGDIPSMIRSDFPSITCTVRFVIYLINFASAKRRLRKLFEWLYCPATPHSFLNRFFWNFVFRNLHDIPQRLVFKKSGKNCPDSRKFFLWSSNQFVIDQILTDLGAFNNTRNIFFELQSREASF